MSDIATLSCASEEPLSTSFRLDLCDLILSKRISIDSHFNVELAIKRLS